MATDLDALAQRWTTFLGKVQARLAEVEAEAREGLAELIATEVLDGSPLNNALNELKARLRALQKKVETAWDDTIAPEAEPHEDEAAGRKRVEQLRRKGEALSRRIEQAGEALEAWAQREAAQRLAALAEAERASRTLACERCGAPLPEPEVLHRAENVSCPHCHAVNTVRPGLAMALYFAGGGLQAKARAQAHGGRQRLDEARALFQARRHPSREDFEALRAVTEAYWREVCLAQGRETPGWTEAQLPAEVRVKVQQALSHDEGREGHRWDQVSRALALAAAGDARGLEAWLDGDGGDLGFDADAVLEMTAERDDARALDTALQVAWRRDAADEPKQAWMQEKRAEVRRFVRGEED